MYVMSDVNFLLSINNKNYVWKLYNVLNKKLITTINT